jgi:hypothetical protein
VFRISINDGMQLLCAAALWTKIFACYRKATRHRSAAKASRWVGVRASVL